MNGSDNCIDETSCWDDQMENHFHFARYVALVEGFLLPNRISQTSFEQASSPGFSHGASRLSSAGRQGLRGADNHGPERSGLDIEVVGSRMPWRGPAGWRTNVGRATPELLG